MGAAIAVLSCTSIMLADGNDNEPVGEVVSPVGTIRRVLISDTEGKTLQLNSGPEASAIVCSDLSLFQGREIIDVVSLFCGLQINRAHLRSLGEAVAAYVRRHDFPAVNVNFPDQSNEELRAGTVRMVVTIGRYGIINSQGHRYFDQLRLIDDLGVKSGDEVRLSVLNAAVNWVNTNPFRYVEAVIDDKGGGEANLELVSNEQRPYRFNIEYDNFGTMYTGKSRYTAGVQMGNMFGAEHQLSYQFTRTQNGHQYQSHSLDYRIPLRWHGYVVVDASYSAVRPELLGTQYAAVGRNVSSAIRHEMHHHWGKWAGQFSTGLNFKSIKNDLEYGGAPYLIDGHPFQDFHIWQLFASETLRRSDDHGVWLFAAALYLSPGGLDGRNTNSAFDRARTGATARYGYGASFGQRVTTLPHDFQLYTRMMAQKSSGSLLASEQLWLGGTSTLRGYPERAYPADDAWLVTQEVSSPAWLRWPPLIGTSQNCQTRVHAFIDAGRSYERNSTFNAQSEPVLISGGLGLRANIGSTFNLSFNYGWPFRKSANSVETQGGQGHLQVRVSF